MPDAAPSSDRGPGRRGLSRPVLGVLLLAVLVVVAVALPRDGGGSGSDGASGAAGAPPSTDVVPSLTPSTAPGDATFCASYRALAQVQAMFASDPTEENRRLLREIAEGAILTGVPDSMGPLARAGWRQEAAGIFASLGLTLDRRAVPGAAEVADDGTSISGPAGAFGTWLGGLCPA